jgi:hypothetical protein
MKYHKISRSPKGASQVLTIQLEIGLTKHKIWKYLLYNRQLTKG